MSRTRLESQFPEDPSAKKRSEVRCLLVEDNPGDIAKTNWSFEGTRFKFSIARDGEEGLEMALAEIPDLIFLDINMPKMDGGEVLRALKKDPTTKHIPVVMLTTSMNEDDVRNAYRDQASAYVQKPVTMPLFRELAKTMDAWWADAVIFRNPVAF